MTKTRILTQSEIRALLSMADAVDLAEHALAALSTGGVTNPLRSVMRLEDGRGLFGLMPGATSEPRALGLKVVAIFPGNHGTELDAHQGIVALFDPDRGSTLAILEASELTGLRTAAASGAATRALARPDATRVAILGAGVQALAHLEAMTVVRKVERARVFSRSAEHRASFVRCARERLSLDVEAVDSAREAVRGAHVVCTTTSAREPILFGDWLEPGMHVNAVGACTRATRELDAAAMARARVFVDSRESAENEAGELLLARAEGVDVEIVAEVGEVFAGAHAGRESAGEITVFESLGVAALDLVTAHHVVGRARERGVGTCIELGGVREVGA